MSSKLLNLLSAISKTFFIFSAKVASINQSGSLNLFSSKELELEQRALLLKRLAFVIYCSGEDQYQKQMPDIQGTYEAMNIFRNVNYNLIPLLLF